MNFNFIDGLIGVAGFIAIFTLFFFLWILNRYSDSFGYYYYNGRNIKTKTFIYITIGFIAIESAAIFIFVGFKGF